MNGEDKVKKLFKETEKLHDTLKPLVDMLNNVEDVLMRISLAYATVRSLMSALDIPFSEKILILEYVKFGLLYDIYMRELENLPKTISMARDFFEGPHEGIQ